MKKILTLPLMALFTVNQAIAAEELATTATPAKSVWKASAELGYVSTSGNTQTETLNAKTTISNDREAWRHKLEITALNASDDTGTTAEKYSVTGQTDYKLTAPNYVFAIVAYENDKFSGYKYQLTESIGYGRRVIDDTDLTLDLEIGPGARQAELDSGATQNEALLRGAAKLAWTISASSQFTEALTVEAGEDATISKSITGLSSQINGSLSMKITYTYKNTSVVPVGVDDTDTETAITLVYKF